MKFLILAGGKGTRLWPISTDDSPKQFHSFKGEKTLIQLAYERIKPLCKLEDIFISSNLNYKEILEKQFPNLPKENFIYEPLRKDTAPCIAYSMKYIQSKTSEDDTVSIIYADHLIQNVLEFQNALVKANEVAQKDNKFLIIEVKAKFANPNLGYAKINKLIKEEDEFSIYELDHFTEKPDQETANEYLKSYKYLWNTGYYVWKISHFFEELKNHAPEIYNAAENITSFPCKEEEYDKFPKISLDYAIIEKMNPKDIWIIPSDLGWSDIGTWQSLFHELKQEDNFIEGNVGDLNVNNSLIINKNQEIRINAININNLAVVLTEKELLVCDLNSDNLLKKYLN